MGGVAAAFAAIGGGVKDVFSQRLFSLALACLLVAVVGSWLAAWAALKYVWPLIPEGEGWMAWLWNAADVLGGVLIVVVAIALSPAISMIVGGALFDVAAERVERAVLPPGSAPGRMTPIAEGLANGVRIAAPALILNVLALPLLFVPVVNVFVFIGLNGFLMGREYFSLAGVRRFNWRETQALRRSAPIATFIVGAACSFIPFVAPLVGAAAMVRLVNWVAKKRIETLR
jgi:uncharacterized protein involved in cysteine biosynthesis